MKNKYCPNSRKWIFSIFVLALRTWYCFSQVTNECLHITPEGAAGNDLGVATRLRCRYSRWDRMDWTAWFCVVWLGIVWFCVVWFCVIWLGIIWFCVVWFCVIWLGIIWFCVVWFCVIWLGIIWFCVVWFCMILICILVYSMVLYSMIKNSKKFCTCIGHPSLISTSRGTMCVYARFGKEERKRRENEKRKREEKETCFVHLFPRRCFEKVSLHCAWGKMFFGKP